MPLRRTRSDDPIVATETWFLRHGMPYFVPSERARVREGLAPRRLRPLAVGVVLVAVVVGVLLAWASGSAAAAPATLLTLGLAALVVYGVTVLRARPILTYALSQAGASLGRLLPLATRALPLLLVFMTFLFINAEVWQMSASLDGASLWVTVMLFTVLALLFFLTRLPEEIERADDALDDERVVLVCRGTPMEEEALRLARHPGLLAQESHVIRFERVNLTLALLIRQAVQVLVLALAVFAFFLVFGLITVPGPIQEAWTGGAIHRPSWAPSLSVELLQVSAFLAAFAGLYFTVFSLTDETYRSEFFSNVVAELEQAIAVRAAYVAACRDRGEEMDDEVEAEVERRREEEVREAEQAAQASQEEQPTRQLPLE